MSVNVEAVNEFTDARLFSKDIQKMSRDEFEVANQLMMEEANRRRQGKELVEVRRHVGNVKMPVVIVPMGDLHIGSRATDLGAVMERVERILRDPNCFVIFTGDLIESVDTKHGVDSLQAASPISEQISLLRRVVIDPLYKSGRVLAAVSGYRAHEGALSKQIGDDAWMREFEGYDIPLVANGGMVQVTFEDGRQERRLKVQAFHNTPGKTGNDPVRPLEKVAKAYSSENAPDAVVGAHDHRAGVAIMEDTIMVRGGTPKGNRGNPDPHGVALGFSGGTDPANQGMIFWADGHRGSKDFEGWTYMEYRMGLAVVAGLRLLEGLQGQGIDKEVLGEVRDKDGRGGSMELTKGKTTKSTLDLSEEIKDRGQVQREVEWNVRSQLPLGLWMLANLRFGSRTRNVEVDGKLMGCQDEWIVPMLERQDTVMILGRQAVDKQVPSDVDREMHVDNLLSLMERAKGRIVGVLYDAVLKSKAWLRSLKVGREIVSGPIWAASDIAGALNAPLIEHMGRIGLRLNGVRYEIVPLDKLENRGSTAFATGGLKSVYANRLDDKPGILMGGHMPGAGVAQFYDRNNPETITPIMVAPGWAATRANWSPGSITESDADGVGPGVVLMPGGLGIFGAEGGRQKDYAAIPIGRKAQWEILNALTLVSAARLGWIDRNRLTRRSDR